MKKYQNPSIELIELVSDEIMEVSSTSFGGNLAGDVEKAFGSLFQ